MLISGEKPQPPSYSFFQGIAKMASYQLAVVKRQEAKGKRQKAKGKQVTRMLIGWRKD